MWLDLRLLARTVPMLARPSGVYNDARSDWGEGSGGAGGNAGDARAVGHVGDHHRAGSHEG